MTAVDINKNTSINAYILKKIKSIKIEYGLFKSGLLRKKGENSLNRMKISLIKSGV